MKTREEILEALDRRIEKCRPRPSMMAVDHATYRAAWEDMPQTGTQPYRKGVKILHLNELT